MRCVERGLGVAIEPERRIGYLDDEKNIGGPGVIPGIEVFATLEQGEVGLRLGDLAQPHRVVDQDCGGFSRRVHQNL